MEGTRMYTGLTVPVSVSSGVVSGSSEIRLLSLTRELESGAGDDRWGS